MRTLPVALTTLTILTALSLSSFCPQSAFAWPWPGKSNAAKPSAPAEAAKSQPQRSAKPQEPSPEMKMPPAAASRPGSGEHLFGEDDEIEIKPQPRPKVKSSSAITRPEASAFDTTETAETSDTGTEIKPDSATLPAAENSGADTAETAATPGIATGTSQTGFSSDFDNSPAAIKQRELQRAALLQAQQKGSKVKKIFGKKTKNAEEMPAPKAGADAKKPGKEAPHDFVQTDRSNDFTYVLPNGWQATKNPMYPHDILVKKGPASKGSLVIAEEEMKGNLSKVAETMVTDLPKHCADFALVSKELIRLKSGVNCARIIHNGKVEQSEFCQVNYVLPFTHGRILVVTGTVAKNNSGADLATFEDFAGSIKVKKKKLIL